MIDALVSRDMCIFVKEDSEQHSEQDLPRRMDTDVLLRAKRPRAMDLYKYGIR